MVVVHSVVSDSCDPRDCRPPGSSVHGVLQARILERVAISFSRGSSWPREYSQLYKNSWLTIFQAYSKMIIWIHRHSFADSFSLNPFSFHSSIRDTNCSSLRLYSKSCSALFWFLDESQPSWVWKSSSAPSQLCYLRQACPLWVTVSSSLIQGSCEREMIYYIWNT